LKLNSSPDDFKLSPKIKLETMRNEIGRWTGKKRTIYLYPPWGQSTSSPRFKETLDGPPLPIDAEFYEPSNPRATIEWYSFRYNKWFRPQDVRLAVRSESLIDIENLMNWAVSCVGEFLRRYPQWRNVLLLHDFLEKYVREGNPKVWPDFRRIFSTLAREQVV
jgi:hypothetical protein